MFVGPGQALGPADLSARRALLHTYTLHHFGVLPARQYSATRGDIEGTRVIYRQVFVFLMLANYV